MSPVKTRIGIIASQEFEIATVYNQLGITNIPILKPVVFQGLVFCISGIGMVNAAIAATMLLERFSPGMLISTGIGGAFPGSEISVGAVAFADMEIYGDTGSGYGENFIDLKDMGFPLITTPEELSSPRKIFNEIPVTQKYLDTLVDLAWRSGLSAKKGPFVTIASVSDSPERARWLGRRYNAICENMEGAAVAHVAYLYGIEFLEIRGISNIAGERNKDRWNIKLATENCQRVLMGFLELLR